MTGLEDDPFAIAPVLGVLDAADRHYLAERSRRRTIDKGQILFTEGDVSDSVVVLMAGHMKVLAVLEGRWRVHREYGGTGGDHR